MNDEQRKEIRQQFWDEDYFDGLPNRGELLKHFINEYGKAIERQQQAEIGALKKEAALQRLSDFTQEAEALKAHPAKELHLSLQKSKQTGELLAVTYTDDEHRIVEVLWQRPPELTDEEIVRISETCDLNHVLGLIDFGRAILRKASEK